MCLVFLEKKLEKLSIFKKYVAFNLTVILDNLFHRNRRTGSLVNNKIVSVCVRAHVHVSVSDHCV